MTTVAFIGLGAMGSRIAMNLHQAGFELKVWNRDRAKTKPFDEKKIEVADSPAAAARGAEFVVSIVADDAATREVMLGASGVIGAAAPGTIVIDSSTNTPAMSREAAKAAAARGVVYLDAPVSGGLAQAQGKELVIMVGGDQAAFAKAQPVFAAMGRMSRWIGDTGAGATVKLLSNMLGAALTVALAEAAVVAEAAGIDRASAAEVLGETAVGSRLLRNKLPMMFKRDFKPQFYLELMEKDVRYFLQVAEEVGRDTPLASLVRRQYQDACSAELGRLDSSAVFLKAAGEK
jgi:3-hydroxyisobutyrate dehydrogenase